MSVTILIGLALSIIVYYLVELSIFSFLSSIKLFIWERAFIISLFLFMNQFKLLSPMLIDPVILLVVLWLHGQRKWDTKLFFLALAPTVFVDLISRFFATSILPYLFSIQSESYNSVWMNLLSYCMVFLSLDLLNYLVGKEYKLFINDEKALKSNQFFSIFLAFILAYYLDIFVVMGFTDPFLSYQKNLIIPKSYKIIFLIFTVFLICLLSYFNRRSTGYLEKKIKAEQESYIDNLENYGQNLEGLYRKVKLFQKDYLDRLDQIGDSIEQGDVAHVHQVYNRIVSNSNEFWDKNHYNISKLSNVTMSSVKSLLSAKIIEAEKQGISVTLEIPDIIDEVPMFRYDLILLLSVFCDNAIEAALFSDEKILTIACFTHQKQTVFIIANSTDTEKVDIKPIFEEGYTSKGLGRGLGLANVNRILQKYNNITLQTQSVSHRFTQTLTILDTEESSWSPS